MRVKNPNTVSNWKFYIEDLEGNEVVIPNGPGLNRVTDLIPLVLSHIAVYDNHSSNEYSKEQRRLAEEAYPNVGNSFEKYLLKLIEHQMCLRNKTTIQCWSEGTGDDIHNALSAVDGWVAKTPQVIKNIVQVGIARITPSHSKTFGGCSACGGSRTMSPKINNLGRAGRLNRR